MQKIPDTIEASRKRTPLSSGHLVTRKPTINQAAHYPFRVPRQGRGQNNSLQQPAGLQRATRPASQEQPQQGDAVHTARSPLRQRHSGLADNLDRATCKITAQGFPTSTSREERLSTKTNTFHLRLLPVLLSLN